MEGWGNRDSGETERSREGLPDTKNDNLSGCRYFGAENGARTRDLNLGKVALYQLSYFRIRFPDWDCKYTTIF